MVSLVESKASRPASQVTLRNEAGFQEFSDALRQVWGFNFVMSLQRSIVTKDGFIKSSFLMHGERGEFLQAFVKFNHFL